MYSRTPITLWVLKYLTTISNILHLNFDSLKKLGLYMRVCIMFMYVYVCINI